MEQLWTQFSLTASCVSIEVCWSGNEVLVSIRIFCVYYTHRLRKITYPFRKTTYLFHILITDVLFVVNYAEWNLSMYLVAGFELGEVFWPVQC